MSLNAGIHDLLSPTRGLFCYGASVRIKNKEEDYVFSCISDPEICGASVNKPSVSLVIRCSSEIYHISPLQNRLLGAPGKLSISFAPCEVVVPIKRTFRKAIFTPAKRVNRRILAKRIFY